jgi:hypothetical protein
MQGGESGGSEPHLFSTTVGDYMVKVSNNPQGALILPNEYAAGTCLAWLGCVVPKGIVVDIPQDVIDDSPGAKFKNGTRLASGLAFGSEFCQSDPQAAVDAALLWNGEEIARVLVLDTWIRNHDGRQWRARASTAASGKYDLIPVDQGLSFGHQWTPQTLDGDRAIQVPAPIRPIDWNDLAHAVGRLQTFGETDADEIIAGVPESWLTDPERSSMRNYLVERAPLAAQALAGQYQGGGSP